MSAAAAAVLTLGVAWAVDRYWGEPPARWHPVVAMGHQEALAALAPSWVLGADGVALLQAHAEPQAAAAAASMQDRLQAWKAAQDRSLVRAGWTLRPSPLHFGLARPPGPLRSARELEPWHALLREHGIKLRDGASFGLPGWVRLAVRPLADVARLVALTHGFAPGLAQAACAPGRFEPLAPEPAVRRAAP
ncbi:MAG: hypothetical protein KGM91_12315 [Burkholderiales bacterium]|nr:hypothetical protein [Burkholderiales bacterium]